MWKGKNEAIARRLIKREEKELFDPGKRKLCLTWCEWEEKKEGQSSEKRENKCPGPAGLGAHGNRYQLGDVGIADHHRSIGATP